MAERASSAPSRGRRACGGRRVASSMRPSTIRPSSSRSTPASTVIERLKRKYGGRSRRRVRPRGAPATSWTNTKGRDGMPRSFEARSNEAPCASCGMRLTSLSALRSGRPTALRKRVIARVRGDRACLGPISRCDRTARADRAERRGARRVSLRGQRGEPARPLARVASGGELSRVLLVARRRPRRRARRTKRAGLRRDRCGHRRRDRDGGRRSSSGSSRGAGRSFASRISRNSRRGPTGTTFSTKSNESATRKDQPRDRKRPRRLKAMPRNAKPRSRACSPANRTTSRCDTLARCCRREELVAARNDAPLRDLVDFEHVRSARADRHAGRERDQVARVHQSRRAPCARSVI